MEKKKEINDAFRNLVFAYSESVFDSKLKVWYEMIHNVEVKPRAGEEGKWVELKSYYDKNWAPHVKMWAKYARCHLPLGKEHTNNRLERAFRTMKRFIEDSNLGKVSTARALQLLLQLAENRLETLYTMSQRKRMQIFDAVPAIKEQYREAAKELTGPGCLIFSSVHGSGRWSQGGSPEVSKQHRGIQGLSHHRLQL